MVNCKKTSEIKQCNEWTPQIGQQSRLLSRLMIFSKIINIFYVVSSMRFIHWIYSCNLKENAVTTFYYKMYKFIQEILKICLECHILYEDDTHVNFRLLWLRENVLYLILRIQYLLIKVYVTVAIKTFVKYRVS